jgi:site-specific recombinase XerD
LLDVIKNPRDIAIVELYLNTGWRLNDLLDIKLEDISEKGIKFLNRKSGIIEIFPVQQRVIKLVKDYIKVRPKDVKSRNIFLSQRKLKLSDKQVWTLIKQYCKEAKLPENISPHSLRHNFTAKLVKENVSPIIIQNFLNHKNFKKTQRYIHVGNNEKKAAVAVIKWR